MHIHASLYHWLNKLIIYRNQYNSYHHTLLIRFIWARKFSNFNRYVRHLAFYRVGLDIWPFSISDRIPDIYNYPTRYLAILSLTFIFKKTFKQTDKSINSWYYSNSYILQIDGRTDRPKLYYNKNFVTKSIFATAISGI